MIMEEFSYQHLLQALNKQIKPYGYKFKVKRTREDGLNLFFFNGADWFEFGLGYHDEEMPELLFDASLFVFKKIVKQEKDKQKKMVKQTCAKAVCG